MKRLTILATFVALAGTAALACMDSAVDVTLDIEDCAFPVPFTSDSTSVPMGCPYRYITPAGDTILVTPGSP
jgi:hypothetical protein